MNHQKTLTVLWFACFALALALTESYFWRTVSVAGQVATIADATDRLPLTTLLLQVYIPPLAAIMAFWYRKPLKASTRQGHAAFRLKLALVTTLLFNLVALYLLARHHLAPEGTLQGAYALARSVALALDFLVVPVNVFYFGAPAAPEGDEPSGAQA